MEQTLRNNQLLEACEEADLDAIKALLLAGADPNQKNKYGRNIFEDAFETAFFTDLDITGKIKDVWLTLLECGWDAKTYALPAMLQFRYCYNTRTLFELFKFSLQHEVGDCREKFEDVLEAIGGDESYERCCCKNHKEENRLYAIYELVEAKMEHRPMDGIGLYHDAVGLRIDDIVCFGKEADLRNMGGYTEFDCDIGFVCGTRLLVLREGINVLFMDDRLKEEPQLHLPQLFGEGVVGSTVRNIYFRHKDVKNKNMVYGQPTIGIVLENGKNLCFTHNFGEIPEQSTQSRFWTEFPAKKPGNA